MYHARLMLRNANCLSNIIEGAIYRHANLSSLVVKSKNFSSTSDIKTHQENAPLEESERAGGFAKAYEKQSHILDSQENENHTFASLLRNSKLIDLGDPVGKVVIGKIFHVVQDDLYIDFGWKFHCVCTRPTNRGDEYVRGTRVRIQINDLELSSRFLGSSSDLTLLEADCKLLGIVSTPVRTSAKV
ncbi:28S ribosomal protein S28, mitochondrial [Galleria mellonella]|uniref:28S ribosomal protein S28, mitochondrial n=1 Tax=Galleria mellonella TaxID=7137 RepID=A0A6J1WU77_GALME|nr:28S ribosomal protein S28, mitochondrial [Galleria mellonella]